MPFTLLVMWSTRTNGIGGSKSIDYGQRRRARLLQRWGLQHMVQLKSQCRGPYSNGLRLSQVLASNTQERVAIGLIVDDDADRRTFDRRACPPPPQYEVRRSDLHLGQAEDETRQVQDRHRRAAPICCEFIKGRIANWIRCVANPRRGQAFDLDERACSLTPTQAAERLLRLAK